MSNTILEKQNAAKASLQFIENGMIVGLGSGSTSECMIRLLGQKVANDLKITGVPSSEKTAKLAGSLNIPLVALGEVKTLDIYIDGADEINPDLDMIKGGGGALLREKILAHNSRKNVIIVDSSKQVKKLGKFKLPLEVVPFAQESIMDQLTKMELEPVLRFEGDQPYETDETNFIIDIDIFDCDNMDALNKSLLSIPGIVETGLFLDYADILIVGKNDRTAILRNG